MWCIRTCHKPDVVWCIRTCHKPDVVWCIRTCHKPDVVQQGIFLLESTFSADSLMVSVQPPQVQSHASTSVRMLKILNTSSYATVWTQENTAHTSRSGQHSEALKVKLKKRKRTVHRVFIQKNLSKSTNFTQTFSQLQNPSMMPKYGTEKQHEGIQIFCTSSKGAQPFLYPNTLYQSKLTGSAFFVILHDFFFFNYCSVLGNAVSEW